MKTLFVLCFVMAGALSSFGQTNVASKASSSAKNPVWPSQTISSNNIAGVPALPAQNTVSHPSAQPAKTARFQAISEEGLLTPKVYNSRHTWVGIHDMFRSSENDQMGDTLVDNPCVIIFPSVSR